ncbi:MAG: GH25 family lysozyme [Actinobacteria bacterium]|nr:GH25 family lysozyme [Actinomycetota bacterium]
MKLRPIAILTSLLLTSTLVNSATPSQAISTVVTNGPGARVHGMDISKWQHPNGAPINFAKMYQAGIRFVMIKASDTRDSSDADAVKYLATDHKAAQAAGIFTGFYHYATLPDSTNATVVISDAKAQAQKALWRLATRKYPLWIAHYGINPATAQAQPSLKAVGCFVHSWTNADCTAQWTFWQYTSCGLAIRYGVPGTRVDLNVYRGTPDEFLKLAKGEWAPAIADQMPIKEPTVTVINSTRASNTNAVVKFKVTVTRPTGLPVVTGTVKFTIDPATPIIPKPVQSAVRLASGSWILNVSGFPAGSWSGQIVFADLTGTHETSSAPVTFDVAQGATPTPKPTPKPTAKPPVVVDSCKNQIIN